MATGSIALNRFGLGARPDDRTPSDPRGWLTAQFAAWQPRPAALANAPSARDAAAALVAYQQQRAEVRVERREAGEPPQMRRPAGPRAAMAEGAEPSAEPAAMSDAERMAVALRRQNRQLYLTAAGARMNAALVSPTPFVERLVHFWANHFAVSADGMRNVGFAGPLEFEAIRPNVLGSFRSMLFAVERHPAMLLYLDQAQSTGPNSRLAQLAKARGAPRQPGLNENLAREILELHTLGVRTGYAQGDVTEFARALTGWTVAGLGRGGRQRAGEPGAFAFVPAMHEPGARSIIGQSYADDGERQAAAVLERLATHPATARHIATKLVRHFVADDPPPAAVARVEAAFLASGGDLPTVYAALIAAPEAWAPAPAKFKTPWEWSVSSLRALGLSELGPQQTVGLLQQLGQPIWRPGSPAGWDDVAASWAGPDAIMRRVEAAERFAGRAGQAVDPRTRAAAVLPDALAPTTAQAIARAESPGQGIALLLVSPDFLRR